MAVTLDNKTTATGNLVNSISFGHTVSGSDRLLAVCISTQKNSGTAPTVTSVTYNGAALSLAIRESSYSSTIRSEVWYISTPATGANNVVVTLADATCHDIMIGAISLNGVHQSSPLHAAATNSGFASSISTNIPTTFADCWLMDNVYQYNGTQTPGAGQTMQNTIVSPSGGQTTVQSTKPATSSGTHTMSWAFGGATDISQAVIALRPSSSVGSFFPFF